MSEDIKQAERMTELRVRAEIARDLMAELCTIPHDECDYCGGVRHAIEIVTNDKYRSHVKGIDAQILEASDEDWEDFWRGR